MDRTTHFHDEEALAGGIRSARFDSSDRWGCLLFQCCAESYTSRYRARISGWAFSSSMVPLNPTWALPMR
jgi:hypothetical protein